MTSINAASTVSFVFDESVRMGASNAAPMTNIGKTQQADVTAYVGEYRLGTDVILSMSAIAPWFSASSVLSPEQARQLAIELMAASELADANAVNSRLKKEKAPKD